MITKVCQFKAGLGHGERLAEVFHPGKEGMEKAAAFFMNKSAAPMLPEVQAYLEKLQPSPTKIYVLVNALGAGEYWGSNINGDWFPEASLIHSGPVYGYETFYQAYPYKHHVNKDPSKSFGKVVLSCWNDAMKRVELIVEIDRERARQFGAEDVCDRLDKGMFTDVSMGCFLPDTLVTMSDGTRRPISEVSEGDLVLTHKGRPRKVTAVHRRRYSGDLYSIKAESHRPVYCTKQHPWLTVREDEVKYKDDKGNLKWEEGGTAVSDWVHAECLSDEYLLEPVMSVEVAMPAPTRAGARLLGYYLADGHVFRNKRGKITGIELTVHKDNYVHKEIGQLCEEFGTRNAPVVRPKANSSAAYSVSIHDERLADWCLYNAGIYSKEKRLSEQVMGWPEESLSEMLGAYANGDGCSFKGSLKLSTASEDLAWQIMALLPRLSMLPSINCIRHKAGKGFNANDTFEWAIHIGKQWAPLLAPYCQKLVLEEVRKVKNSRKILDGSVVTPIRDISSLYVETEVFNLEVEEDESYLVDGLAVHNCKVPYDLCSKCLDWEKYRKAQSTFDPSKHRTVGVAVLEFHKKDPIRGLSVTRNDYCAHLKTMLNKILEDGTKIYAINDYPRFFDISFVFIGADKTAKVMAKLAFDQSAVPSWMVAEELGYVQSDVYKFEKVAGDGLSDKDRKVAVGEEPTDLDPARTPESEQALAELFQAHRPSVTPAGIATGIDKVRARLREKKASQLKGAEITKAVIPSQFGGKVLPASRPDIPTEILDELGKGGLSEALSTPTTMGMILKPREFQRITIIRMGKKPLADDLDRQGLTFPPVAESDKSLPLGTDHFSSTLKRLLLPLMEERSLLEPIARRRIVRITICGKPEEEDDEDLKDAEETPFLQKISAAYNGYLDRLDDCLEDVESVVGRHSDLWATIHGSGLADGFEKTAAGINPLVLVGAIGGAYGLNQWAKWEKHKAMMGARRPVGVGMDFMAESPKLLMLGAGLAALEQQKSTIPRRLLRGVVAAVKGGASGVAK